MCPALYIGLINILIYLQYKKLFKKHFYWLQVDMSLEVALPGSSELALPTAVHLSPGGKLRVRGGGDSICYSFLSSFKLLPSWIFHGRVESFWKGDEKNQTFHLSKMSQAETFINWQNPNISTNITSFMAEKILNLSQVKKRKNELWKTFGQKMVLPVLGVYMPLEVLPPGSFVVAVATVLPCPAHFLLLSDQSWALEVFSNIFNDEKYFCLHFYQVNNLFLHQSYWESQLSVKLTWEKMQKIIFYYWKNEKIPQVPSSGLSKEMAGWATTISWEQGCQVWPFRGQKTNLAIFSNWLASKF